MITNMTIAQAEKAAALYIQAMFANQDDFYAKDASDEVNHLVAKAILIVLKKLDYLTNGNKALTTDACIRIAIGSNITQAINIAREAGYELLLPSNNEYFMFSNGIDIGYCQYNPVGGFMFTKEYKPSKQGSGLIAFKELSIINTEHFKKTLAIILPKVIKWENFKAFRDAYWDKRAVYDKGTT